MRADLKACTLENIAFELIPDFGNTADFRRTKCMRQRGWTATPREGIYDYARIHAEPVTPTGPPVTVNTSCPPGTHKEGQGCRYDSAPGAAPSTEPTWATGF